MRKLFWFAFGIALGFLLAHLIDATPRGHAAFGRVNDCLAAFTARAADAYRDADGSARTR